MSNGSDLELKISAASMVVPDHIDDTPAFPVTSDPDRINQQRVLPAAIQTRLIGNLFSNNPTSDTEGSGIKAQAIVPNSSSVSFLFILSDSQGRELIAVPDVAFYIGNTITSDTHWPNQSFGMGNMPIAIFNDWGLTDNRNVATRAIIRNNTGADQSVICACRFRIIANPGTSGAS